MLQGAGVRLLLGNFEMKVVAERMVTDPAPAASQDRGVSGARPGPPCSEAGKESPGRAATVRQGDRAAVGTYCGTLGRGVVEADRRHDA